MFTILPATRRENARTEAFVRAIHRSADCIDACCTPVDDTVLLPRIVATADPGPAPAVLESTDSRVLLALVGLVVTLAAILGGALMSVHTPEVQPAVVVDHGLGEPERTVEVHGLAAVAGAR